MDEIKQKDYNKNQIYKEALGFRNTYMILKEFIDLPHTTPDICDYMTPMTTSIIFSCELFLKTILIHYKISFKKDHTLLSLFNKLPSHIKANIKEIFPHPPKIPNYFESTLRANNASYTKFRYYFSYGETITFDMNFFESFNDILLEKVKCEIFKN